MKKVKFIFSIAYLDMKSRKKRTRLLFTLIVFSVTLFLVLNSLITSLKEDVENIVYKPYGRVISVTADYETYGNEMTRFKEVYEGKYGIEQLFWHIFSRSVVWTNAEIVGVPSLEVSLMTAVDELENYLVEGNAKPGTGEMIVPKYLYDVGIYGQYNCADGSELLGQTLCFEVASPYDGEPAREFRFKVVGVYDNVKSGSGSGSGAFCISSQDALSIDYCGNYKSEEEIQQELVQLKEAYQLSDADCDAMYESMHWQPEIGFYVSAEYDLDEVVERLEVELGRAVHIFQIPVDSIADYYDFIIFLGNLIVGMLGMTVTIVLVVTILRDLRERKGQFALRYACGYTRGEQCVAYILETLLLLGKACLTGGIITAIILMAGNYIINHIVPFYMRGTELRIHPDVVLITAGAVICGSIFSVLLAIPGVFGVHTAEILKQEEGR